MANSKIQQFGRSLDTMTECPICNKRLTAPVYMCGSGHSICTVCTNAGAVCSLCCAPYTKIPNLLVENFLSKYDCLKKYLKDLDDTKKKSTSIINVEKKPSDNLNDAKDRQYRCWITDKCQFTADVPDIVEHFKNVHIRHFDEHLTGSLPYKQTWEMNYCIGKNFDRAIKIKGLVFIVHISINGIGKLGACVLMYTSNAITDQYVCQMEIECVNKKLCYKNAKVVSAKSPVRVVFGFRTSGLHIGRNKLMYNALRENQQFKCTVSIKRRDGTVVKEKTIKQTGKKSEINVNALEVFNKIGQNSKTDTVNDSLNLNVSVKSNSASSIVSDELEDEQVEKAPDCLLFNLLRLKMHEIYMNEN